MVEPAHVLHAEGPGSTPAISQGAGVGKDPSVPETLEGCCWPKKTTLSQADQWSKAALYFSENGDGWAASKLHTGSLLGISILHTLQNTQAGCEVPMLCQM